MNKHYDQDYFYHLDDNYKQHQKAMNQQRKNLVEMQKTIKDQNWQKEK